MVLFFDYTMVFPRDISLSTQIYTAYQWFDSTAFFHFLSMKCCKFSLTIINHIPVQQNGLRCMNVYKNSWYCYSFMLTLEPKGSYLNVSLPYFIFNQGRLGLTFL